MSGSRIALALLCASLVGACATEEEWKKAAPRDDSAMSTGSNLPRRSGESRNGDVKVLGSEALEKAQGVTGATITPTGR